MKNRLPTWNEFLSVLAFTGFLVYGRMLFIFLWKIPSWLMYQPLGEIFSIFSYSLVISFLESVGYAVFLSVICFVLPATWFKNGFISRGVWLVAVWLISWMVFFARMYSLGIEDGLVVLEYIYPWLAVTLGLALAASFLSSRVRVMANAALWLADRTVVFLFLFVPMSAIGLLVVVIRNLS